jgi:NAD(P)-dependent dehydrogenase (short-subunit alcohol dehydrogenase family)
MTRTIIVTGGNTGIGEAIATEIASNPDHHVVIVSRSRDKGEAALKRIRAATANNSVELVPGDLSTIRGCHDLADALLGQLRVIHVLVNNAGIMPLQRELNADGLESAFMVNHMAPFILSLRLLERLRENAPARIVQVGAGLYGWHVIRSLRVKAGSTSIAFKQKNRYRPAVTRVWWTRYGTSVRALPLASSGLTTVYTLSGNSVWQGRQ